MKKEKRKKYAWTSLSPQQFTGEILVDVTDFGNGKVEIEVMELADDQNPDGTVSEQFVWCRLSSRMPWQKEDRHHCTEDIPF